MNHPYDHRVVIIDDQEPLRRLIVRSLPPGFTCVAEAGDGQEGIEQVRVHQPDLVLLDLSMPRCDGLEALRAIRRRMDVRVLVFSGYRSPHLEEVLKANGASGLVHKSASLSVLARRLQDVMDEPVPFVEDKEALLEIRLDELL